MIATEQFLRHANHGSSCHPQDLLPQPRTVAKWCAYALALLLPGSFVVLPLLWLYRRYALPSALPIFAPARAGGPGLARLKRLPVAMMRLVMIVIAGTLVAGCASFPAAPHGDGEQVRLAANEGPTVEQPDAPAEGAKSCRNDADNAFKRGAEVVAKVVGGVVTGAALGAVGGVGIAFFAMATSGGGATCLDPTTCGSVGSLVAGMAAIGAVIGAVAGATMALREIESTRPATGMSLPATCSEHRPWRQLWNA